MEAHRAAIEAGSLPSAVIMAADLNGDIDINESFGVRNAAGDPMTDSTVLRMASCTKLLTAIAVMQAVERGLLDLDAPVKHLLPELGELPVLSGYSDAGKPVLSPQKTDMTLSHLLTHSSGFGYSFSSPLLERYCRENGLPVDRSGPTVASNFLHPLLFDPGAGWIYGCGLDWAGRALEAATGTPLDVWLRDRIAAPLAAPDMTFFPQRRPDLLARHADIPVRDAASGRATHPAETSPIWRADRAEPFGGGGVFASPAAFFAVLRALLRNDARLLAPDSRAALLAPRLGAPARAACMAAGRALEAVRPHGLVPAAAAKDFALAGVVTTEDLPGWRRAGGVSWSGMPNHYWNVDPEAGVAVLVCYHLDPWADDTCVRLGRLFEEEVYALAKKV